MDQGRSDVAPRRDEVPLGVPPSPPTPTPARQAPLAHPGPRRRGGGLRVAGILLSLLLGLWLVWRFLLPHGGHAARTIQVPQPVGVAKVGTGDLHVVLTGLGTVTPLATITVQTQISGQLMSVGFKEGQIVNKGDFLAQIDQRPYQVALDQAEGTLARDTALLGQAKSDLARYVSLNRQDSISKQQVTDQQFLVQQDQGTVQLDRASVDSARLNLAYCHIVSPVTGRVGLRLVDPGNYVQTSSSTGLAVVTQEQPISVIFVLPEDDIPDIAAQVQAGAALPVAAYDHADSKKIADGTLSTVDNTVDTTTGTVKLRATFPNTDSTLFPNQFVNAHLLLKTIAGATKVPAAAVQHGAPGTFVYLVKPDSTVGVRVIKTGVTDGDDVQVLSGLAPGDTVVVDGTDRLKDGAKIRVGGGAGAVAPVAADNGPGAPPGEQPQNATPAPGHKHHRKPQADQ